MKKYLFIIFWVFVIIVLLLFSVVFKDTRKAIVAQVEPMKTAVSYHKAVRILEIYVIPGQRVNPGDPLVKVERPDLLLDVDRKKNRLEQLESDIRMAQWKFEEKQRELALNKETDIKKIDGEIAKLQIIIENNQQLSSRFGSLTGYADTARNLGSSYYEIEIEVLKNERKKVLTEYKQKLEMARKLHEEEIKTTEVARQEMNMELELLEEEEQNLIRKADIKGTIGSVNAQVGELLSPYSTIMSIYEANPTVIRAFMNEGYKYDTEVNKTVIVESANRQYSIEGKIMEIGKRIVQYPARLQTNVRVPMWGQELFIKIPKDNKFFNGERVFVIIKE